MIRIALLSNLDITQKSYPLMLQQYCECKVVFQVKDNQQLVAQLNQNPVDVVLYCCELDSKIDLEAINQISKNHNNCKVLIMTHYYNNDVFQMALNNHFIGYIKVDVAVAELKKVIHQLHKDGFSCHQQLFEDHTEYIKKSQPTMDAHAMREIQPTKKQLMLLPSFFRGLSATEISKKYHLSEAAINKHRSNILQKVGQKNMIGACCVLLEKHVVTLEQLTMKLLLIFFLLGNSLDYSDERSSNDWESNSSYEYVMPMEG